MKDVKYRLANLLSVKSIVTIVLTGVFAFLAITDKVNAEQFIGIFTVIVAFYFGTQAERRNSAEQG